jgi:geranylgeranyl diphosphate synthase type II
LRRRKLVTDTLPALDLYLQSRKEVVDAALERVLPGEEHFPPVLFQALRYSIFAGGKRLRPILCIAAAEAVGGIVETVLPAACALELIHTYSLIHDDLPAMDNDDYRRGKLTNHKVFGEGMAILAGDALLTEAFHLLSGGDLVQKNSPDRIIAVIRELSEAAGFFGMVGGQVMDMKAEGKRVDLSTLYYIHTRKTGAMIKASVRAGAILAGAPEERLKALGDYGEHVGLAFQIADDILDVEGDPGQLGKETGADDSRKKATFPALIGVEASKEKARNLIEKALGAIVLFDEKADPLRWIARFIVERKI